MKNKIITVGLLALFIITTAISAFADTTGALTVICKYEESGRTVYLEGDELSITRIATATEDAAGALTYTTLPEFESQSCDWGSQTAESLRKKASSLAEINAKADSDVKTGSYGEAVFGGLVPGVYLVTRTGIATANKAYVTEPLLVLIPQDEEGSRVYYITAEIKIAKSQPEKDDTEKEDPKKEKGKSLIEKVRTGDFTDIYVYALCFAIGTVILLMVTVVKRLAEKKSR